MFSNPLLTVAGALLLATLAFGGWQKFQNLTLERTIAQRETTITTLKDQMDSLGRTVADLQKTAELNAKTTSVLEESVKVMTERAAREASSLKEIENAPQSSDGPVAPVLRDALKRL